jgi:predicted RNA-binding Zn-ribbon protein involved in translation (DUF1610 family)
MNQKQKLIYAAVITVVVGAVLAIWGFRRPPNNANFPEGTDWLCTNRTCNNHFNLTMKDLGQFYKTHYGQRPKCPKCGSEAIRATVCPSCHKVFPQARDMFACPYCGKPLFSPPPQ